MLNSLSGGLFVVSVVFGMILGQYASDSSAHGAQVVINEIHSDPDLKTEWVEYVELYNAGDQAADLSGWQFSAGIFYTFGQDAVLAPGDYLIVAQSPEHVLAKGRAWRFALNTDRVLGPFGGKLGNEADRLVLRDAQGAVVDEVEYQLGFPWPTVGDPVPATAVGTGHSLQLINPLSDNDLAGSWRSAAPTPTGANRAVYTLNVPPLIRQVTHAPQQPHSGETVTVTAKITDPDGVDAVILHCQVVEPGHYIRLGDAEYSRLWTDVEMNDSALNGDRTAGDSVYTVQLPKTLQTHRRLIRYRVTALDAHASFITVPYEDDPQPNFAYFVYDGVPAWSGAIEPGDRVPAQGQPRTYGIDVMRSLPVYHLLSKARDVEDCQFRPISDARCNPEAGLYQWTGALVYDGVVYDHIRYRARGGWATYEFGKNRWKFDFNRGHYFQAHDDYGRKYPLRWDKLNFSACFQFDNTNNRGEHGMYEAASARLMALAGVPVSSMHWLQFRVIDDAVEASPSNQYQGDLWGLYLAIEQPDGRFLKARGLPDGNLYKMYFACSANPTNMNNQGPTQVTDHSDVRAFWNAYRAYPASRQWWDDNVNLPLYYNYRLICDAVHHYDLSDAWNILYYHHPETERWWAFPWDFDHSWDTDIYTHDDEYWKQVLAPRLFQGHRVTHPNIYHEFPDCIIDFQNRARELQDLLLNQDQCVQLINDCAALISDPQGAPSFVDVDRAMWDHHPRTRSQGSYYRSSPTGDFAGMVERMRTFISPQGWGYENIARIGRDALAPGAPEISYAGPAGYPVNALTFETTAFAGPLGDKTFGAQQWRMAEVEPGAQVPSVVQPDQQVLIDERSEWRYFKGVREPSPAPGVWREVEFPDADWLSGHTPLGYGEAFIETALEDMRGSYSTLYLRKDFEVVTLAELDGLVLEVIYDDGVNVWINGRLVMQGNVDSDELPFNATTATRSDNHNFTAFTLSDPTSYLNAGTNVLAVQAVNQSLGGSSDCFIEVRLTGRPSPQGPDFPGTDPARANAGTPSKYEIDALWESPELTSFASHITIPGSVVRSGHTYRARHRVQGRTGRWSHWSAPLQFVAGPSLSQALTTDLRITELMINPADPPPDDHSDNDDFEFVELKNIGDQRLDLSHVSLTDGVRFDFKDSRITHLDPGQFVLIVRNEQAFAARYGPGLYGTIAGEYAGRLANGGETVRLEDFWHGLIVEFSYDDGPDWPEAADGAGHSLVPLQLALLDPEPGALSDPSNWRASIDLHGSPGREDL